MFGKDSLARAVLLADLRRWQAPRLYEIFSLTLIGADELSNRPESPPEPKRIFQRGHVKFSLEWHDVNLLLFLENKPYFDLVKAER
jgi:hypothetical protein